MITHLAITIRTTVRTSIGTDGTFPNISPDYSAPPFALLKQVVGWVLGGSTILLFLALIIAIVSVVFKGFGNERLRGFATANIGFVILGVVVMASITGIFAWASGLDLGFSSK